MKSAVFGQVIILIVYVPIFASPASRARCSAHGLHRELRHHRCAAAQPHLRAHGQLHFLSKRVFRPRQLERPHDGPRLQKWYAPKLKALLATAAPRWSQRAAACWSARRLFIGWAASSFPNWMKATSPPTYTIRKAAT
jgi:hypothetical protein